ncbi:hypothetical protein AYO20_06416 [Fonsecaea nubica]|uniref:Uncharacterized protein n=1 Tax=Fonsecaea nubica TaxID=856822 RepID=A0A178CZ07_9EURO|nr:hypothetical protein AYO20_06416 [Fonsecaea nubica]OAL34363.1 hypothetical protein AYO20_06416 [Fonsecaea nubica]
MFDLELVREEVNWLPVDVAELVVPVTDATGVSVLVVSDPLDVVPLVALEGEADPPAVVESEDDTKSTALELDVLGDSVEAVADVAAVAEVVQDRLVEIEAVVTVVELAIVDWGLLVWFTSCPAHD